MMKKIIFVLCVALLSATSCLSGGTSPGTSTSTFTGRLTVSDIATGAVTLTDNQASVTICIPNIIDPKFDIIFNGVKFSNSSMEPKKNVEVLGIPFTTTVSEDESSINYVFDGENIIPMIGGVSYEKYTIDRIWGCVGRVVEVNFTMASKQSKVTFTTDTDSTDK